MRHGRRAWALLALAALLAGACSGDDGDVTAPTATATGAGDGEPTALVTVRRGDDVAGSGCALLAADAERRRRGLMARTDLAGHVGMVFTFDAPVRGTFWMRNTPLPLSIAFFDDGGRFVSAADMAPCGDRDDCPGYAAAGPYRYALEVRQGGLDDLGVGPGATLTLGGPCTP